VGYWKRLEIFNDDFSRGGNVEIVSNLKFI
jgi:hypothetical protein